MTTLVRRMAPVAALAAALCVLAVPGTALAKGKNNQAWHALANDERRNIEMLERALLAVKDGDDYHAIRGAIDTLNEATTHLAELMMDTAVSTALKGKAMDDTNLAEQTQTGHRVAKAEFE